MNKNILIYLSIFLVVITSGTLLIKYSNNLDNNIELARVSQDDEDVILDSNWDNNGMFKKYYTVASRKLDTLTLDEKIGQLLLVRHLEVDDDKLLEKYNFAGYIFYEDDFTNKSKLEVINMMDRLQSSSKIPILTAVDEEGGSVVRVSSNSNLVESKFLSPSELYNNGGFDLIKSDTANKSNILFNLGINLNLAPVVDVSTDPNSYIYDRTLKQDTELTSMYSKTVIEASMNSGVSYVLKHFPGYGNNGDTHLGISMDSRSFDDIYDNDLPPFKSGIDAGAEAILVSHNIVTSIDDINPASLSTSVHNLLRKDLGFTGIIISDDLAMGAVSDIDNAAVKAILAGNDLIIVTDFQSSFEQIKDALDNGTISEELIDEKVNRIIAWKYYKGLMYENQK